MAATFGFKKATNHQYITDLVVYLFDITKNNREEMDKYLNTAQDTVNKLDYINQFCTMVVGSTRGSGHTHSILNLVNIRRLNTVLITPTVRQARILEHEAHNKPDGVSYQYQSIVDLRLLETCQINQFIQKQRGVRHIKYDLIAFDMTFMFDSGAINKVKEIICMNHINPLPFFLFLQPKL